MSLDVYKIFFFKDTCARLNTVTIINCSLQIDRHLNPHYSIENDYYKPNPPVCHNLCVCVGGGGGGGGVGCRREGGGRGESGGGSSVARLSCILRHGGVQLRLAYSWAMPAILAAGKGRGGTL